MIRDAFINGLLSNVIRQRLLENKTLDLSSAFDQARSLDVAQQNSNLYSQPTIPISASIQEIKSSLQNQSMTDNHLAAIVKSKQLCWFCGNIRHPRTKCPAREAICHKCKKVGHFEKLCRSSSVSAAVPKMMMITFVPPYQLRQTLPSESVITSLLMKSIKQKL